MTVHLYNPRSRSPRTLECCGLDVFHMKPGDNTTRFTAETTCLKEQQAKTDQLENLARALNVLSVLRKGTR